MTAQDLIAKLQTVPSDAQLFLYDHGNTVELQAEWAQAGFAFIASWRQSAQFTEVER